ncbi:MAG: hypothetical protein CMJ54_03310 [Planctomycetaceae bacterium]|nr:hypothetical protein [Planctomycetaceae bacterium]
MAGRIPGPRVILSEPRLPNFIGTRSDPRRVVSDADSADLLATVTPMPERFAPCSGYNRPSQMPCPGGSTRSSDRTRFSR